MNGPPAKCWHCRHFVALVYEGTAALCTLPNGPRVIAQPARGCSGFQREPGADDEPGAVPAFSSLPVGVLLQMASVW